MAGYLFSVWGVAGALVLGWPATRLATGRSWGRALLPALAVKLPSALVGPFLLFLSGGFVLSFAAIGLAANVVASSAMYTLVDLAALRIFLRRAPTRAVVCAFFVANLVLLAAAMTWFVLKEPALLARIRAYY